MKCIELLELDTLNYRHAIGLGMANIREHGIVRLGRKLPEIYVYNNQINQYSCDNENFYFFFWFYRLAKFFNTLLKK